MATLLEIDAMRWKWWGIGLAGSLWILLGLFFFTNAVFIGAHVWPGYLAIPLIFDGLVSLAVALGPAGASRIMPFVKVSAFMAVAVVIIATNGSAEMAIGLLVGGFLIVDAIWRCTTACLDRAEGWRLAIVYAVIELLLGFWSLLDHPSQGAIGSDVSLLLMNSGFSLCVVAGQLRRRRSIRIG